MVQSVMALHAQDPPGLEKGDPTKQYNYETIEAKVTFDYMYSFEKVPNKSCVVTNIDASQLNFPVNEFIMPQFKAEIICKDMNEGKLMKIRFSCCVSKSSRRCLVIVENQEDGKA